MDLPPPAATDGASVAPGQLAAGRLRAAWLAYAGIAAYALLAALARPLTLPSVFTVLAPGIALLWWGARRVPLRVVDAGRATAVTWLGLGLLFCAWEVVALCTGNDPAHPTFSILADPALDTYPGRVAGYLLWLSTGAWLVSR
ncbi:hypothetical protein AB0J86_05805 [Micromonospora sp. NPDC049559]|uniref:hypothetical protein n=1 Tax=Micromonospora sp. NPDC049559 TaxID=3155923 RepID=UPI00341C7EBD